MKKITLFLIFLLSITSVFATTISDDFDRPDNQDLNANYGGDIIYYDYPINLNGYSYDRQDNVQILNNELYTHDPATTAGTSYAADWSHIQNASEWINITYTLRSGGPGGYRWYNTIYFGEDQEQLELTSNNVWHFGVDGVGNKPWFRISGPNHANIPTRYYWGCSGDNIALDLSGYDVDMVFNFYLDIVNKKLDFYVDGTPISLNHTCNPTDPTATTVNSYGSFQESNADSGDQYSYIDDFLIEMETLCEPDWACSEYSGCTHINSNNEAYQECLGIVDQNSCGESFTGSISDYDAVGCTFNSGNSGTNFAVVQNAKRAASSQALKEVAVKNPIEQFILNLRTAILRALGIEG